MSNRSQAELEYQYHQRWAQVQSHTISPQQAFGNMEDWVVQLGQRKAFLHPNFKQWLWYDRLHDSWVAAGCGPDEAILLTIGSLAGLKKLPKPDKVAGWCVYQQGQELYGPVRIEELLNMLKSQPELINILVWSPLATRWLSVVYEIGEEISFCDDAGNQISLIVKGEVAPAPTLNSPKQSSPQKPPPTLTEVMPQKKPGQIKPPANIPRRPPPPEKL